MKVSRIIYKTLILFPILLGGCFRTTNRFDNETDEDAIKRIKWWGVDIPEDTEVLARYYSPNKEWDGGWNAIYHTFEIKSDFKFKEGSTTTNYEIFETKWSTAKNDKLFRLKDEDWPEFDKDMECSLIMQLEKATYGDKITDTTYEFSQVYLDKDENHGRLEKISKYDNLSYIGKAYIIYQPHSKKIYSFFIEDTSLSYKLKD